MLIRPGRAEEMATCQDIERAAGEPFRELGMDAVADDEPLTLDDLESYRRNGALWVAQRGDELVGYLLAAPVDGRTHVEQVSVRPRWARRGIGRALIDHAALAHGGGDQTLTTFADVPWNAPYYRRLGFRELPEDQLTPGLRHIRTVERRLGLDRWPRLCMLRTGLPRPHVALKA
ncbi:GNAT family N-acetyltransferase [Streptomyces sp. P38-E01]|uniref:GNAT family N-acetyltransferase n=1 Tax=Streptomyces tardus TaxID=2780544 RepID=A0A949N7J4_9ACTN|nr:GNAT family N-acetyltransferase [Streptomyces tardus]MBU7600187.1 GNAT family N-acetyltransferase [Streptomyces tardus]